MDEDEARPLRRDELHKVDPKLRKMVEDSWAKGEDVPFGVTCLDFSPLTDDDKAWLQSLVDAGR